MYCFKYEWCYNVASFTFWCDVRRLLFAPCVYCYNKRQCRSNFNSMAWQRYASLAVLTKEGHILLNVPALSTNLVWSARLVISKTLAAMALFLLLIKWTTLWHTHYSAFPGRSGSRVLLNSHMIHIQPVCRTWRSTDLEKTVSFMKYRY